jgi:nitrite reductase (NADH) large subunit
MRRVVVIGNGMAGARLVEEIVARGGTDRLAVTVLGSEPHGGYSRIALSGVLAGERSARDVVLNPHDWYADAGVNLRAGVAARAIDRRTRSVTGADGAIYPYDELVLATGSRPAFPPVEGLRRRDGELLPGAFGFRSLDDCEAISGWARGARRAVVVGGGLLGLEAARGLLARGLDVEIVHRAPLLMNLQLDADAGALLRARVERLGMRVRLAASARRLIGGECVDALELDDGTQVACDLVVFATGVRPEVELAERAGLRVERGIVVDDALRAAGCRNVHAIGDCAEHRGVVTGLWAPAWEQATVVAERLCGTDPRAAYHGVRPSTKLKVAGIELATMGDVEPRDEHDEVIRYSEPRRGIYKSVIVRDGRVAGAILLGDVARAPGLTQALEQGTPLPEQRAELLFDLAGANAADAPAEPPDGLICLCNGVSRADIEACVAEGRRTLREVAGATRASTGCGGCADRVVEVVEWAARAAA